jgi:hypothetical protein
MLLSINFNGYLYDIFHAFVIIQASEYCVFYIFILK